MYVIGTAGHVDHGKSTLVTALTGINPDRLKEEQEREMTIDLGFAWLTLPNGGDIGIIDVPGHRDFIDNMLAGIGGIDAALLVVAADEGIMPQTREHLAILDLLQIHAGVVALSKIDLVTDSDWLDLIESDIGDALQGTVLEGAPIVRVSARSKVGLTELIETLEKILMSCPERQDHGRPRLPIDRVFSIAGFGTVVTGTLADGHFNMGDEVEILPSGLKGRIRGLQTHKQKAQSVVPGSRTAINISGVNIEQINRGDTVAYPGQYQTTRRIDVQIRLLQSLSKSLRHAIEVKLFLGAAEIVADVRLIGSEVLKAGEQGWLQLDLHQPVVTVRGDRYIIRRPSPGETLGGGIVVDPFPKRRHKRFDDNVIQMLNAYVQGSSSDVLIQTSKDLGPAMIKDLAQQTHLDVGEFADALSDLLDRDLLVALEDGEISSTSKVLVIDRRSWEILHDKVSKILAGYHKNFPLRRGIPREELKSRLGLQPRVFNALLRKLSMADGLIEKETWVSEPDFTITFNEKQKIKVDELLIRFNDNPYAPPSVKECHTHLGEDVFEAMVELDLLVCVSEDVVFRKHDYDNMLVQIRKHLSQQGQMTVAEIRDLFNTSRRYVLAFLEHLDALNITVRDGDVRRLK